MLSGAQRIHDADLLTERAKHHKIGKLGNVVLLAYDAAYMYVAPVAYLFAYFPVVSHSVSQSFDLFTCMYFVCPTLVLLSIV